MPVSRDGSDVSSFSQIISLRPVTVSCHPPILPPFHSLPHPLTPSHTLSHPLTPSHTLSHPLTPSHTLSHPLPSHTLTPSRTLYPLYQLAQSRIVGLHQLDPEGCCGHGQRLLLSHVLPPSLWDLHTYGAWRGRTDRNGDVRLIMISMTV